MCGKGFTNDQGAAEICEAGGCNWLAPGVTRIGGETKRWTNDRSEHRANQQLRSIHDGWGAQLPYGTFTLVTFRRETYCLLHGQRGRGIRILAIGHTFATQLTDWPAVSHWR